MLMHLLAVKNQLQSYNHQGEIDNSKQRLLVDPEVPHGDPYWCQWQEAMPSADCPSVIVPSMHMAEVLPD